MRGVDESCGGYLVAGGDGGLDLLGQHPLFLPGGGGRDGVSDGLLLHLLRPRLSVEVVVRGRRPRGHGPGRHVRALALRF